MSKAKSKQSPRRTTNSVGQPQGRLLMQWRYAWRHTLADIVHQPWASFLTVMVIAISLTLPSICYLIWKNIDQAAQQWCPTPELTVYLDKAFSTDQAQTLTAQLANRLEVEKAQYVSASQAVSQFKQWSGFDTALALLDENPLPAVIVVVPKTAYQSPAQLSQLRKTLESQTGVESVRIDESGFAKLAALTHLVAKLSIVIGLLMIISVFLVIGNSIRLTIFARRETINVMKLLGATDGFILRPFLNGGMLLAILGTLCSSLFSSVLLWQLAKVVQQTTQTFATSFPLQGFYWEEVLILLIIAGMVGWLAAWLATVRHLRYFTPE